MSNVISDSVSKLSAITDQTPIDWDAFDYNVLPRKEGKHMEFLKRKVGDEL